MRHFSENKLWVSHQGNTLHIRNKRRSRWYTWSSILYWRIFHFRLYCFYIIWIILFNRYFKLSDSSRILRTDWVQTLQSPILRCFHSLRLFLTSHCIIYAFKCHKIRRGHLCRFTNCILFCFIDAYCWLSLIFCLLLDSDSIWLIHSNSCETLHLIFVYLFKLL